MPFATPFTDEYGFPIRERILVMAMSNVGKSTTLWHIAHALKASGSTATVFIIDTDNRLAKMKASPLYRHLDNVMVFPMANKPGEDKLAWEILRESSDRIKALAGPHDWIGLDMAGRPWKEVQTYALCILHGHKTAAAAAEAGLIKRSKFSGDPGHAPQDIEGFDWKHPNAAYDAFISPLLYTSRAHFLGCIPSVEFEAGKDKLVKDQEKRRLYGTVGAKPEGGQKDLVYGVDTVLHITKTVLGRYVSSAKEFERPLLRDVPFESMVTTYLRDHAGWEGLPDDWTPPTLENFQTPAMLKGK